MIKEKIIEQVNKIYKDYDGYFYNKYEYDETKSYHENNIFRYKDNLYLVLSNVSGITPSHDLKLYCRIPKTENDLSELMKELGYIKNRIEHMDLDTLKLVYKHIEDRLEFLDKNRHQSKSIIGMELACQLVLELMVENKSEE